MTVTNGMTITAAELADLTFTSALNDSTNSSFTYTVNDGGTGITSAVTNIIVKAVDDIPTLGSVPVTAATEDAAYNYNIATTDNDGIPLTITATTLPTWMTLTENGDGTASLTGTPTNAEVGSHSVVLEVTDGITTTTQSFSIIVSETNETPTFTTPNTFSVDENETYVATLTSSYVDGVAPTYSLVGAIDDDRFMINAETGELRFLNAPDFENTLDENADNTYNLRVQLNDGRAAQVAQSIAVMVNDVNEAPSLAAVQLNASEGFVGNIGSLIMTDPDAGDELTLSIVGGSAQPFFSVDSSTGTITQNSSLAAGLYTLEVQLLDANGMSTKATLQVRIFAVQPSLGAGNTTNGNIDMSIDEAFQGAYSSNESSYTSVDSGIEILAQTNSEATGLNSDNTSFTTIGTGQEQFSLLHSDNSDGGRSFDALFAEKPTQSHHLLAPSPEPSDTDAKGSVSRGYSVVLELLFDETDEAFDMLGDTFAKVLDGSLFSITFYPDVLNAVSSMHSDVDEQQQQADERLELIITTGAVASVTLTVGFVSWLLQGGSLLATTLSTSPLWRSIDPVPVLLAGKDDDE